MIGSRLERLFFMGRLKYPGGIMNTADLIAFIAILILALATIAVSIFLLLGRGEKLIAGILNMPEHIETLYNKKALSRFYGGALLIALLFFCCFSFGLMRNIPWLIITSAFALFLFIVISIAYANNSPHFKNKKPPTER
jgi:uncharacterized BrkB/YihY/UPF0761 family membrane protein